MNSKQRRRDQRAWRYEVMIPDEKVSVDSYNAMFDWCESTWGNGYRDNHGWREKHGHFGTCWQFTQEKKAVAFALKWR